MRVYCDWEQFHPLLKQMKYIFVEEKETSFLFLGKLDNHDLIFEYQKSEDEEENLFFIQSHFNGLNVFKVRKIESELNVIVSARIE